MIEHEVPILQVLASCLYGIQHVVDVMDNSGLILGAAEAQDAYESMMLHLRCYSWLAIYFYDYRKPLFKMRPKCHYMWHQATDVLAWKLNMNMFHTFSEESLLGRVKAIAT